VGFARRALRAGGGVSSLGQPSFPTVDRSRTTRAARLKRRGPVARNGTFRGRALRSRLAILTAGTACLSGCAPGGWPALLDFHRPPFDAFQAAQQLQVGMPREVAIIAIGSSPLFSQSSSCGVATTLDSPCEVMTFGVLDNNRLDVYLVPTGHGFSVVTSWLAHKG